MVQDQAEFTRHMRATGNKVLVRQDEAENMKGSLYLPQGKEEHSNTGTVLSVGPKVQEDIKVGDRVMFTRKPESHLAGGWGREGDFGFGVLALGEDNIVAILGEGGAS